MAADIMQEARNPYSIAVALDLIGTLALEKGSGRKAHNVMEVQEVLSLAG